MTAARICQADTKERARRKKLGKKESALCLCMFTVFLLADFCLLCNFLLSCFRLVCVCATLRDTNNTQHSYRSRAQRETTKVVKVERGTTVECLCYCSWGIR